MTRAGNPQVWIIILIAVGIAQVVYFMDVLPEPVATHFDHAGRPDGWSSIGTVLALNVAMPMVIAALFWFVPHLLRRLPDDRINLPRKEYWLAPERRAATLDWMVRHVLWFGAATLAFLIAVFGLVLRANLVNPPRLSVTAFWILLGGYLALMVAWCTSLIRRFVAIEGRS